MKFLRLVNFPHHLCHRFHRLHLKYNTDLDSAMSSAQYDCNLLIPQLLTHNLLTNGLCNFCKLSLHLHHQFANSSSTSTTNLSKSSSTNKLLKSVITDLPIWRKPYKTCTPFFKALEQLFSVHDVTDELQFKRYLYLALSELSDADKTYAFDHIINTSQSWSSSQRVVL